MKYKWLYTSIFIFLCSSFPLISLAKDKVKLSPMTIEDVINIEIPYQLRISHDNRKVLWVQEKACNEDNENRSAIWMTTLSNNYEPLKLTGEDNTCWSPEWSPDDKNIAFLSDRIKDKPQVFIISPSGGEGTNLFKTDEGVDKFAWKDNKTLIFLARENKYYYEKQLEDSQDDSKIFEDKEHFIPYRLFSYSLKDKKITRLTKNKDRITDFIVSPDGKWAVTVHIDSPLYGNDPKYFKKYYLLNLNDLSVKQIFKDPYFAPHDFEWGKDGTLYMIEDKSNYEKEQGPGMPLLYEYDIKSDKYREIPIDWKNGIGLLAGRVLDTGGDKVATFLAGGVINHFVLLDKTNGKWNIRKIEGDMTSNITNFGITGDGRGIVFVYSKANEPPKLYYGNIEGNKLINVITLADLNKNFEEIFLARREIIHWPSEGGRNIEGILYYPKDYKEGEHYPLILSIHGGPSWYDSDAFNSSWAYYPHILAYRNSFVLEVNYSGSANYGLEFQESIFGHYYELEIPDLLTGVDYLINKGMADPKKLATMGWSNGSILSIALTVHTDRFKAACCGAGDVNWISDYGNCDFGVSFDNLYLKGPYWENIDYYIEKSPLFKMNKVTTPTLIMFGDSDITVPAEQGFEHYRALQQLGKAPVKFVIFPGETHSLNNISNQKRKMEEELAWLDKYLFNKKDDKKSEAFMEGSPLDLALKKIGIKYDSKGNLGVTYKKILVPETLEYNGTFIGRFEVTRAQFSIFLKEEKDVNIKNLTGWTKIGFKAGTGNYPVSGVDINTAGNYCKWLSKKTGKNYRLPTEKEMEDWITLCEGEENTLDYWAGYSLSPDEIIDLEKYIKKLEKGKGLILPVGTFGPSFENFYDINGNIGELCSNGAVKGLYAIHTSDPREPYKTPISLYTGFRVIMEK